MQARDRHPYLKRFVGDWATQAIATQYLANRVGHAKRKANPDSSYNRKRMRKILRRRKAKIQPWMASTSAITQDHELTDGALSGDEEMLDDVASSAQWDHMQIDSEEDVMDEDGAVLPDDDDYMAEQDDDDMVDDNSSVFDESA